MGFVATTLSISDPIGRLQKALLVIGEGFKVQASLFGPEVNIKERALSPELQKKFSELKERLTINRKNSSVLL
jgi:hypothetical protein